MKKAILLCTVLLLLLPIIVFMIYLSITFPSETYIVNKLIRNESDFIEIVNFFKECGYEELSISYFAKNIKTHALDTNEMGHFIYPDEITLDEGTMKQFKRFFKKYGHRSITKKINNVSFLRGTNLRYGSGVLYLIEGDIPINDCEFHELKKLSLNNWYYYVEK